MPPCQYKLFWLGLILPCCFGLTPLRACNVPVFRYALERWRPDPYVAVVFQNHAPAVDPESLLEPLIRASESGTANVRVRAADITGALSLSFRALWDAQQPATLPWLVVRYPPQTGIEASIWAGPPSLQAARALLDSPVRQELGRRLLRGDSVVWLLLTGLEDQRNDVVEQLLASESASLAKTLELPERGPEDPEISADPPLRIAFSTLRLARSNPAERVLVSQLLSWHPGLLNESGPILFPVFGRGRVLPPATGDAITAQTIEAMARLLTGPCSCQIKEMNAGFDLLMNLDWGRALVPSKTAPSTVVPPMLVGLGEFAASTTNATAPRARTSLALGGIRRDPTERDPMTRNLIVLGVLAAIGLGFASVILRAKNGRSYE